MIFNYVKYIKRYEGGRIMTQEQIITKMEEVAHRVEKYVKKHKVMGLDDREMDKYYELLAQYLKLKMLLEDAVFNKNILRYIMFGKANRLSTELSRQLRWNSELLVEIDKMKIVHDAYENVPNKKLIKRKIETYYGYLKDNLIKYYNDSKDKELFGEVSHLLTDGQSQDFQALLDHLDYKFEALYIALEGDYDEEIN
jgi:hypothetical protein